MSLLLGAALSFVLDLLFGDPEKLLHPVVVMGKIISRLEKGLRAVFPQTPKGELAAGFVLALLLPVGTLAVTILAMWAVGLIHPMLRFALGVFWGWQALALKGLNTESKRVYRALTTGTIEEARTAVSRIVGRDTDRLDEAGVTRAAVETVAENFSDGVLAPLFYLLIGGAPLALCYKAINTMDSMVGYKNERYLCFGRCAAKLDDAANWIPARLSALLLILSSALLGENAKDAWRVWRRDRRNHASPNSAQTEAAMAGALGIQLAGPAWYFGEKYDKPTIGDAKRSVEPNDILRADRLLYGGGALGLVLLGALRWVVLFWGGI